jgi:signal transduction histidine kinase
VAAFVCVAIALACVLLLGAWGAWRDLYQVRATVLRLEMNRVRSLGERTVGNFESQLADESSFDDLGKTHGAAWLRRHWQTVMPKQPDRLYGAVVDASGKVAIHSRREFEGRRLETHWYERELFDAGEGVVETASVALAGGQRAIDVQLPITAGNQVVATYHSGIDVDKLQLAYNAAYRTIVGRWALVIGGILVVVLFASMSLFHIARSTAALHQRLSRDRLQRETELSQLMVGLAHEVRNPLNAIRLNLHMIGRDRNGKRLSAEDWTSMVQESLEEVERVEALISEMLNFAPGRHELKEQLDLAAEIRSEVKFVQHLVQQDQIELCVRLPEQAVSVRFDRARFRQLLLNLLNNAREAAGCGGRIEIEVVRSHGGIELIVSDSGPGVPASHLQRIFEPFFTTKETGVGLGLALVKRFVEEAGGNVHCEANEAGGSRFCVWLPESFVEVGEKNA